MNINSEQLAILDHTVRRAACGFYCEDSPDVQALVDAGLMESAGFVPYVPDEYFRITDKGRDVLRRQSVQEKNLAKEKTND